MVPDESTPPPDPAPGLPPEPASDKPPDPEATPDPVPAPHVRARELVTEGAWPAAVREIQQALDGNERDGELWFFLGQAEHGAGHLKAAQRALERATKLARDDERAWFWLGSVQNKRGNLDGALKAFKRALDLAPRFWDAWASLGMTCIGLARVSKRPFVARGYMEKAKVTFQELLARAPAAWPKRSEIRDLLASLTRVPG